MRVINSKNHVLATERGPAQFRPGNQLRLERARASNPSHAEHDAFAPNPGEARSGNMVGDNGLSRRGLRVHTAILKGSKTLSAPHATTLTTPMKTIGGAAPQALTMPGTRALTVPMPPADVRGMDGLAWGGGWSGRMQQAIQSVAPAPQTGGGMPLAPGFRGGGWGGGWGQAVAQVMPRPAPQTGGGMPLPSWAVRPQGQASGFAPTLMYRPIPVPSMRPSTGGSSEFHPQMFHRGGWSGRTGRNAFQSVTGQRRNRISMQGLDGLGALDTSSLMLAVAAIAGVYFLTKNRRTA